MFKIINFPKKKEDDEYESCIVCKCKTDIKRDQQIEERYGYIEGAGQLCYDCYKGLNN